MRCERAGEGDDDDAREERKEGRKLGEGSEWDGVGEYAFPSNLA